MVCEYWRFFVFTYPFHSIVWMFHSLRGLLMDVWGAPGFDCSQGSCCAPSHTRFWVGGVFSYFFL